ncbi:nucleotidyltransferase family protein [Spirochaeta isovalerica]|uniref:Nucleotidyltransferase family protein n=1 Tax=Spirochaeta isovalerica TaxID=150 RepID=A0A841R8D2_9SPIO|nr:nucleotidyltransferase family protein [Spirochaeta isovalerica]MBB6479621.1 hypothetical protein [Spirochaeta isovalerica]
MNESRIIIDTLCHGRWDDTRAAEMDPRKLLSLAHRNKVLVPLSRYVFDHRIDHFFKGTTSLRRMRETLLLHERDKGIWLETLHSLVPQMEEAGIDVLLLKGLSYETDIPRDMGDLDLLVRPEQLEKAIALLEKNGFVYAGGNRGFHKRKGEAGNWERLKPWSNQFEFLNEKTGLLIELHTEFFHRDRVYRFSFDSLLDRIEDFRRRSVYSKELKCRILSVEDRLLLLCIHTAVKRAAPKKTFALRNILDIENFIAAHPVDWQVLQRTAEETGMLLFLLYSLETAKRFFPDLPGGDILKAGNDRLTSFQRRFKKNMHNCFYDLDTARYFRTVLYELGLPFAVKSRLKHKISSICVLPVLFPEPWRLRQLYGFSRHSPWFFLAYPLEPVRWIRVALRQRRPPLGKI